MYIDNECRNMREKHFLGQAPTRDNMKTQPNKTGRQAGEEAHKHTLIFTDCTRFELFIKYGERNEQQNDKRSPETPQREYVNNNNVWNFIPWPYFIAAY